VFTAKRTWRDPASFRIYPDSNNNNSDLGNRKSLLRYDTPNYFKNKVQTNFVQLFSHYTKHHITEIAEMMVCCKKWTKKYVPT
jgi:hypothetical protein